MGYRPWGSVQFFRAGDWGAETAPILEASFHARYFLEMAVRYGKELKRAPRLLPSEWAALLCLFDLR